MFDGVPTKCAKRVEPMRFPAYLSKSRHGIWYFRFVFPDRIRALIPSLPKEVRKSMQTRDAREAAMRSRKMALDLQSIASYLMTMMGYNDKEPPAQLILDVLPDGTKRIKCEQEDTAAKAKEYIAMLIELGVITPQQANNPLEMLQYSSPTAKDLIDAKVAVAGTRSEGPWLSEAIDMYREQNQKSNGWSREKTWYGTYEPILRHFREIISTGKRTVQMKKEGSKIAEEVEVWDIRTNAIGPDHVRKYIRAMWDFPANWGSSIKSKTADAKDALIANLPKQSAETAFKKQRMTKTFLIWAHQNRLLSEDLSNIFPSQPRKSSTQKKQQGYQPWTQQELQIIFERELVPYEKRYRDMMFWAPLIGLYAGARANEISQLTLEDIVTEEGILSLRITDLPDEDDDEQEPVPGIEAEKRIKNESSRRSIPIHPKLIEIGFMDYIKYLKAKNHTRLFPEVTFADASGYGRKLSREWQKTAKELNIWKMRKKVFHSFRSTLNGRLFKNGVSDEYRELILGHTSDSTNSVHYLKDETDTPYQKLHSYISRVDFGLNHPTWSPPLSVPDL